MKKALSPFGDYVSCDQPGNTGLVYLFYWRSASYHHGQDIGGDVDSFLCRGGIANIPYTDIIGKIIPVQRWGAFIGGKGAIAGPLFVYCCFHQRWSNCNFPMER